MMEAPMTVRRPRRTALWWTVGIVVVVVGVGGLLVARNAGGNGKKKKEPEKAPAAAVELSEVRRGGVATYLTTTTTLEARNTATLVARRQGQVIALLVEEGQWVEQGATLARLDDTEARLAVQHAELEAEQAAHELDRGKQLATQGFLSTKELDDLGWKDRSARVSVEQAKHDLSEMRIVAPFAGRVTDRTVNLGETVTAGKECFRVSDFDPILARVYFPEREAAHIRVGQTAIVELDSHPNESFPARVSLVNPVVDRGNGTFKVTLEVRDTRRVLRPGSFARVKLQTGRFDDAVLLPRRAMLDEDGDDYVFVARGDTVSRIAVRIGAVSGDTAQVLAGVVAGDKVVTVGQGGLKQGARIKPVRF
jgi:RND family efflux transporter MFP subunit